MKINDAPENDWPVLEPPGWGHQPRRDGGIDSGSIFLLGSVFVIMFWFVIFAAVAWFLG